MEESSATSDAGPKCTEERTETCYRNEDNKDHGRSDLGMGGNKEEERTKIIKSSSDKRLYRAITLPNELFALLISDPETYTSAAALNVSVGHLNNPNDLPGLAHFCEHMLFEGSKKYPDERNFDNFISKGCGEFNAVTGLDYTCYHFQIASQYFEGALDRLAQFFISPLFTEMAMEQEINAIHSEYERKATDDDERIFRVLSVMCKNNSPFKKFFTGNKTTLVTSPKEKGIDLRSELIRFYERWYSSNIMKLVVLGKESLNDLEKMVVSSFSDVVNKKVERSEWTDHPIDPDHSPTKCYIVPINDYVRELCISFSIPYVQDSYDYIMHFSQLKGPGSLQSVLKAKGWIYNLSINCQKVQKLATLNVTFNLQMGGLEKINEIINSVFQYLNMLRTVGPQKYIFEEYQKLLEMEFKFGEKQDPYHYVQRIAADLDYTSYENVLLWRYTSPWAPDAIEAILDCLKPSKLIMTVVGKEFDSIADEEEPIFGTKYITFDKISEKTIRKWENCGVSEEFKLPLPNEFIPTNFDILYTGDGKVEPTHPLIIHENSLMRVWFKQDNQFFVPKANMIFDFYSPLYTYFDILNDNMKLIYVNLLNESLEECAYQTDPAGLSFKITNKLHGIRLEIEGYNDKQNILLDKIIERMVNFKVDFERLESVKDSLIWRLKHKREDEPDKQAPAYLQELLLEKYSAPKDDLKAIGEITVECFENFISEFLSKLFIECLIHGNVDEIGAFKLIRIVKNRFNSTTGVSLTILQKLWKNRTAQIGSDLLYETPNKFHKTSFTQIVYQCGTSFTENNMMGILLNRIINDYGYNSLRTIKKELGSKVNIEFERLNSVLSFKIDVLSEKHPNYVNGRIEDFLNRARELIENMTEEHFKCEKETLSSNHLNVFKKFNSLTWEFWNEISSRQYNFNRGEIESACLLKINKSDLSKFFDDYIRHDGQKRRKLSIHIVSQKEGGAGTLQDAERLEESLVQPIKIEDVEKFKESREFYSVVQEDGGLASMFAKSCTMKNITDEISKESATVLNSSIKTEV